MNNLNFSLLSLFLMLSISCISKNKIKDTQNIPNLNVEKKDETPVKEIDVSKEQKIKSLYLILSEQLEKSNSEESQDLAKLANAVSETSDADLRLFLTSDYSETVVKNMNEEAQGEESDKKRIFYS